MFLQSHSNVDLRTTCCVLSTALNSVLCLANPAQHTWVPSAQTPVWFLPLQTSSMKWAIHGGRMGTPDLVILIPHGLWHSKVGLPVVTLESLVLRIDWNTPYLWLCKLPKHTLKQNMKLPLGSIHRCLLSDWTSITSGLKMFCFCGASTLHPLTYFFMNYIWEGKRLREHWGRSWESTTQIQTEQNRAHVLTGSCGCMLHQSVPSFQVQSQYFRKKFVSLQPCDSVWIN